MELNQSQKQYMALGEISKYMEMVSQVAQMGHTACRMINKSFQAHQNKEIQDLINICRHLAVEHDLDFEVNIDSYNYDYNYQTNPHCYPMEFFVTNLQSRYYDEHGYSISEVYNPVEDVMSENDNIYWDSDSEVENPKAQSIMDMLNRLSLLYPRDDNTFKVGLKPENIDYEWQSSGGSLC